MNFFSKNITRRDLLKIFAAGGLAFSFGSYYQHISSYTVMLKSAFRNIATIELNPAFAFELKNTHKHSYFNSQDSFRESIIKDTLRDIKENHLVFTKEGWIVPATTMHMHMTLTGKI